jgi:hypothetical protein
MVSGVLRTGIALMAGRFRGSTGIVESAAVPHGKSDGYDQKRKDNPFHMMLLYCILDEIIPLFSKVCSMLFGLI